MNLEHLQSVELSPITVRNAVCTAAVLGLVALAFIVG